MLERIATDWNDLDARRPARPLRSRAESRSYIKLRICVRYVCPRGRPQGLPHRRQVKRRANTRGSLPLWGVGACRGRGGPTWSDPARIHRVGRVRAKGNDRRQESGVACQAATITSRSPGSEVSRFVVVSPLSGRNYCRGGGISFRFAAPASRGGQGAANFCGGQPATLQLYKLSMK